MRRLLLALSLAAGLAVVPSATNADPGDYVSPVFGIATAPDGSLVVADAGQGIVQVDTDGASVLAALPGATAVAPIAGGGLWALTGIADLGDPSGSTLYRIDDGDAVRFADIFGFEKRRNPHKAEIDSNGFDVADLGGGNALVVDAGGNDLLKVGRNGKVKLVAVLPNRKVSTAYVKSLAGCPEPEKPEWAEVCDLPPRFPAEAVPTSVAIGPDGAYYVGELKGLPAGIGVSRVWRIAPNARNARCGQSPLCSVALRGFTSVIDLAFGPDGRLYVAQIDDAGFLVVEEEALAGEALGGSVHACDLGTRTCEEIVSGVPVLTSIAFRDDGSLWGATSALIPGEADVVQLVA